MLVDLRVDIADFSDTYVLGTFSAEEMQSHFDEAIENAMQPSGSDLQVNISSQLVSLIVAEVLPQVAIRLGVSAGILETGAASGWTTLGIGVVVGLIIDQIVMAIWSQWNDPAQNLEHMLNSKLVSMQHLICYGDPRTKGLRQRFEEVAAGRAVVFQHGH